MKYRNLIRRFLVVSLLSIIPFMGLVKANSVPGLSETELAKVMDFFKTDEGKAMIAQAANEPGALKMPVDQLNMMINMQIFQMIQKMNDKFGGGDKKKAKAFFDKTFGEHSTDAFKLGLNTAGATTKALAAYVLGLVGTSASIAGGISLFALVAPYCFPYLMHNAANGVMQGIYAIPGGLWSGSKLATIGLSGMLLLKTGLVGFLLG